MPTSASAASRAVKPRVNSVPPYDYSDGADAVALAASAGLHLDPWQRYILEQSLGVRHDGLWSAFEVGLIVGRQNGKGALLEARELFGLFLVDDERLILHSAHEFKTATEAFRRILGLIEGSDDLRKRVKKVQIGHGDEGIELRDGSRLRFVARSTGSGRGFTGDLIILDEAYALTDKQMEALLPTLSARPNPQLWYTSTPPLDAVAGAQLMALRKRGHEAAPRLAYFEYSAPGDLESVDRIDLDDRALWAASNPALGIRISEEFIKRERAAMSAVGFARERLCVFPRPVEDNQWQVIPEAAWLLGRRGRFELADPVAFGVDVTPDRTWSAIAAAGRITAGGRGVDLVQHEPGTGWLIGRLRQLVDRHRPCVVVTSDRAVADAAEQERLTVYRAGAGDLASAASMLFDGVAGPAADVLHLGQGELTDAVAGATRRTVGDGWSWDRRSVQVDICPLVAASLALWGLSTPRVHSGGFAPFALT